MRKMLTAMALIALVTPVLTDKAKAATGIHNTLATINQIDVMNSNTINVVTVEVIDAKQLGGNSLLTNLVATKTDNSILIKRGKETVLISLGVKGWENKTLELKEHQPSLSVNYEWYNRPLPATRGKPDNNRLSLVYLAGATGGLRNSGGIVWRDGGSLLTLDGTSKLPSEGSKVLRLGNQETTREILVSRGRVNQGVIRTMTNLQRSSV